MNQHPAELAREARRNLSDARRSISAANTEARRGDAVRAGQRAHGANLDLERVAKQLDRLIELLEAGTD